MSIIESNHPYPEIDRYWDMVKRTLEEVFQKSPSPADTLREDINKRPAEEQLQFYHAEPLDVAADLAGERPTDDKVKAYRNLADLCDWR